MSRRFLVRHGEATRTAEIVGDGQVRIDGLDYRVEAAGPDRYRVTTGDGKTQLVVVAGAPASPWVGANGRVAELEVAVEGARTVRRAAPAGEMTAPMPATVVSIAAPVGTRVAANDPVVVLEAMKMELTVRAPRDGVVTAVHCRAGDLIKPGTLLAELDQ